MDMKGNTILITGGGSGIGRGLAEALHAIGNRVIIAGRRPEQLEEVVDANPGIISAVLDVADPDAIRAFAARVTQDHPQLNVLVNNAGIMKIEDVLAEPFDLAEAEETIAVNLLGPIRLTAAQRPNNRRAEASYPYAANLLGQTRMPGAVRPKWGGQQAATVVNVTSGLAFVPRASTPTYCATKAAMHSYSQSLRYLLRSTAVRVIELVPPLVATDLTPGQRDNPWAMPLDDYIKESMALLAADGGAPEILVERVKMERNAEARGDRDKVFAMINAQ